MNPARWAMLYWPLWLGASFLAFLSVEVYALATGRPENTLSWWVWNRLGVTGHGSVWSWDAADFLSFGLWLVLVVWLTFHLFFRKFT